MKPIEIDENGFFWAGCFFKQVMKCNQQQTTLQLVKNYFIYEQKHILTLVSCTFLTISLVMLGLMFLYKGM